MFNQDAPEAIATPEPESETARRAADQVERRRARGGRRTTTNPTRSAAQQSAPQPASNPGIFGLGFGQSGNRF